LVTENAAVRKNVRMALQATPVSGAADAVLSEVLGDQKRLEGLLARNRVKLGEAMDLCADWAAFHTLPYVSYVEVDGMLMNE
jgi:hypothetical protein